MLSSPQASISRARKGLLFPIIFTSFLLVSSVDEERHLNQILKKRTTMHLPSTKCARKAVQERFRRWASRMTVDPNGAHVLKISRIIIPKEYFIPVLLKFHLNNGSSEHCGTSELAQRYQMAYTWSQLNYGPSLEHAICAIYMCPRLECR